MPTTSAETAFLAAIAAAPDDDGPKLVFADWLEEQGDTRCDAWRWIVAEERRPRKQPHPSGTRWQWWNCARDHDDIPAELFDLLSWETTFPKRGSYRTAIDAYTDLVRAFDDARQAGWK